VSEDVTLVDGEPTDRIIYIFGDDPPQLASPMFKRRNGNRVYEEGFYLAWLTPVHAHDELNACSHSPELVENSNDIRRKMVT
jgi:hypothetical protein